MEGLCWTFSMLQTLK
uniref:Uncharacterized protein n=1 Tax=Anguilla anguilla TaxID=7936 RepID=A0A0E9PCM2_ANGAN